MLKMIEVRNDAGNATFSAAEAVGKIEAGSENLIRFEKGIYHFGREGCKTREMNAVNIDHGIKHVVFDLEGIENLTVDGCGSEFIFDDILFPFALTGCKIITLKNFIIDFSFSRYCQGDITVSDESGFELAVDKSLFRAETDGQGHVIFHSCREPFTTANQLILLANSVFGKAPWDYLFAGDTSAGKDNLPTGYIETDASTTERGIRFTYREGSRRPVYPPSERLLFCYEPRANADIFAGDCENINIEHVSLYRAGGMGIVAARTKDFFADYVAIKVRPGRDECRSTTADGFYFVQCSGRIEIRNSEISETLDDALNIHGIYNIVSAKTEDGIVVKAGINEHTGFAVCDAGDKITFSDSKTHRYKGNAVVRGIHRQEDGSILLKTDGDCAEIREGDLIENDDRAADFIFENNRVFGCPHLRISDNGKIVLRGNTFERISALLIIDLLAYWYESGAVKEMTAEDNLFLNTPRAGDGYPVIVYSSRSADTDIRHANLSIRNNRFICPNGHALSISSVDGLSITGNTFEGGTRESMFALRDCTEVREEDNRFIRS
ncbi:MAG: hypothetical protein ACYCWE_03650 [Eubacteriales bacterium]